MAADDFYVHSAQQRMQVLEASRAQALANLEQAKTSADYDSAGDAVQAIADIDAEKANLLRLHQQYIQSQQPARQPELSPEERAARRLARMAWNDASGSPRQANMVAKCSSWLCRSSAPPRSWGMTMFGDEPKDLYATLSQMERLSRERTNFDQMAAREKFKEFLERDRRFDDFDKDRLVARVQECRSCGATLDLDDPRLKGGEARPLSW